MNVLPCKNAQAATYASKVECQDYPDELPGVIQIQTRLVSSDFDPDLYYK